MSAQICTSSVVHPLSPELPPRPHFPNLPGLWRKVEPVLPSSPRSPPTPAWASPPLSPRRPRPPSLEAPLLLPHPPPPLIAALAHPSSPSPPRVVPARSTLHFLLLPAPLRLFVLFPWSLLPHRPRYGLDLGLPRAQCPSPPRRGPSPHPRCRRRVHRTSR